jgi:hypothetical protein
MAIQALTPPQDITWTRMAFTRDMIDTNFGDMIFSPKWRSSLSVYYYIVPDEDTADNYPNSRIVYLKLSTSITGWNPNESLLAAQKLAQESGSWDDLQRTLWEVIVSSGWASTYWPCLGAIMQLAVYPNAGAGVTVAPDDYPYVMDFEPKKRELYEQVTEGGEFLAGSAEKLSTTKGTTNTQSVDVQAGGSFLGIGASVTAGASWQQVDSRTTDTSRESRETTSHSTSFSQMYQLFNGYHLGTNRALFVVAPRPHTVSSASQTEFNLINGERNLEGVQEVFLVIHMTRSLAGFCIQAGLDTGHLATVTTPQHLVMLRPNGNSSDPPQTPPPPPTPTDPVKQLIVTRRVIQACGTFDDNGSLQLQQLREPRPPIVVGEISVTHLSAQTMLRMATGGAGPDAHALRVQVANNLNTMQADISRAMLNSGSAANYAPRKFEETAVFKSLVANSAKGLDISLGQLASRGYLEMRTAQRLGRIKLKTVGDLFAHVVDGNDADSVQATRMDIVTRLLGGKAS